MNYKHEIYRDYVSNQTSHLYGEVSLKSIEKQFYLWDYMYGKNLPASKQSEILDMGCGNGSFIYYLQKKGYENVMGVDISEQQIQTGNKLGIRNLHNADLKDWLLGNQSRYDCIIARDVLEHFTKTELLDILKSTLQSLKDHGNILIQVPNGEGIWHQKIFYGDITHETLFSSDSIRQVLLSAGYKNVYSFPLEFPVNNLKSMIRKTVWNGMVYHHRFRKWIATGDSTGIFTPNLLALASK